MDTLQQISLAAGFAAMAGVNLYLTTFVTGLALRLGWVELDAAHHGLAALENPWVLGVAGGLFLVEAVADKVPWVDSAWDVAHTAIRPVGGALLALAALGDLHPAAATLAALLAGGTSLTSHLAKASGRLALNLSPEPVTNSAASVGEDAAVLGGLGLMALSPWIGLLVFVCFTVGAVWILHKTWRFFRAGWRKLFGRRETPA